MGKKTWLSPVRDRNVKVAAPAAAIRYRDRLALDLAGNKLNNKRVLISGIHRERNAENFPTLFLPAKPLHGGDEGNARRDSLGKVGVNFF